MTFGTTPPQPENFGPIETTEAKTEHHLPKAELVRRLNLCEQGETLHEDFIKADPHFVLSSFIESYDEQAKNFNPPITFHTFIKSFGPDGIALIQTKLVELGYNLGPFGPKHDGVDGLYGPRTKSQVEKYLAKVSGTPKTQTLMPRTAESNDQTARAIETREQNPRWPEIAASIQKLETKFNLQPNEFAVVVNPARQELYLVKNHQILKTYPVSTAKNGLGNEDGSKKTPIGTHRIGQKVGDGAEIGTVFRGRKQVGKMDLNSIPKRGDGITTRVMVLNGQEDGINQGKINGQNISSEARNIYIHGTPYEAQIGKAVSNGCVRMNNTDVIELFDLIPPGTLIEIQDKDYTPRLSTNTSVA